MSTSRALLQELIEQGVSKRDAIGQLREQCDMSEPHARSVVSRLWKELHELVKRPETPRDEALKLFEQGDVMTYLQRCESTLQDVDQQGFVSYPQILFLHCRPWVKWLYTDGNVTPTLRKTYPRFFSQGQQHQG